MASFFATQHWNGKAKKFEPMLMLSKPCEMPYVPIGWQPFPRPEQQRANAIRLKPGQDFTESMAIIKYRFQHSRNQSKRIHKAFEGGDLLMPKDDLADFADSLQSKISFPQSTLDQAFKSYGQRKKPQDTAEKRASLMAKAGITLEEHDSFKQQVWHFNQENFDAEIQRMLSKVGSRIVLKPPNE